MNVQTTNPRYATTSTTPSPIPNYSTPTFSNPGSNASSPIPAANTAVSPPPLKFFRDLFGLDSSSNSSSSTSPMPMQFSRQDSQSNKDSLMGPYMLQLHQQFEQSNTCM